MIFIGVPDDVYTVQLELYSDSTQDVSYLYFTLPFVVFYSLYCICLFMIGKTQLACVKYMDSCWCRINSRFFQEFDFSFY